MAKRTRTATAERKHSVQSSERGRRSIPAAPAIRGSRPLAVSATKAKNEFGRLLDSAIQGRPVLITKHDAPKAVLISKADFDAMTRERDVDLAVLTDEFDAMIEGMQTPKARAAMQAAFEASPSAMGRAAVAAARRRG